MNEMGNLIKREDGKAIQPLPEGGVLLHIGPPKTGTSALQGACHACRDQMRAQGVRYAGRTQQSGRAAYAALGREHPTLGEAPSEHHWKRLVREVRAAKEPRTFVSSEFFAGADDAQAARIVRELGGDRVHVALTLRPVSRILASRWQQNVQEGARYSFDQWLHWVFEQPNEGKGATFWSRQRHDHLAARWASIVGPERLSVVMVNEQNKSAIYQAFEALLNLQSGTLEPQSDTANRSMTAAEIELIRALNERFADEGITRPLLYKMITRGTALYMKRRTVGPEEPKQQTPSWAVNRADLMGWESAAAIRALGVQVIGDLSALGGATPIGAPATPIPPLINTAAHTTGSAARHVPEEVATRAAMGMLFASGAVLKDGSGRPGVDVRVEPQVLQRVHTVDLLRVVAQRLLWMVTSRIRKITRR
ncbi:MAG: hypothetical protein ACO3BX_05230 [Candidatus Limnocylindrus sp.]